MKPIWAYFQWQYVVSWIVHALREKEFQMFITLRPRQNAHHFADDILKCIFFNENEWSSLKISLNIVPKVPINNIPALVLIIAWRRQATRHYLNQWWLIYWFIYASLGLNELYIECSWKGLTFRCVVRAIHSVLLTFKRVGRIPFLEQRPQLCQEFHVHYSGDLLWESPAPCILISHHDVCRCLSIKMSSYQYRDSHVKDKTVSPTVLSLTWESPCLGKTVFILRRGPGRHQQPCW